jgi:hypothetical protein
MADTEKAIPTYTEDHEIRGARMGYGSSYETLIAAGAIVAPTREELPDDELAERLKANDEKRAAESTKQ